MLTVYKASAGSGKTFRLAVEYIKRLIENTNSYENILAVTFTNKATEEMKMRILSQLYGLSNGLKSSDSYLKAILKDFNEAKKDITEQDVRTRCGIALERMLHNYTFFRVETIDRFFQTILKNLARELDLTPNLRVELGDVEIEHQAVDSLIDNLHENDKETNKVLGWILDFMKSSLNDDKSWNVISSIKSFAETIFKDEYKEVSGDLTQRLNANSGKQFTDFINTLKAIRTQAEADAMKIAQDLWQLIKTSGFSVSDFNGGSRGIAAWIEKLATTDPSLVSFTKTFDKAIDPDDTQAENWYKKGSPQQLKDFCRDIMRPRFISDMKVFKPLHCTIKSVKVTMQHMSQIRLLNYIEQEIRRNNEANDRFLLSDTQTLLSKMIDGSDSPFIYEKIGANLHNIMIDEFQDTSRCQWSNFKVLLNNCLASGFDNLIVGDVKQSIYRWRSGDWRLLGNIGNEFQGNINIIPMHDNFRSSRRIIDFNNAFFTQAADNVCKAVKEHSKPEDVEMLKNAYKDVRQTYPKDKEQKGFVQVEFIDAKDDYDRIMLERLSDTISQLLDMGIEQKRIAILLRTKKQIPAIAAHCQQTLPEVNIVSDEAYLLSASVAAQIIINAMRLLVNPDDDITRATLSICYQSAFNTDNKTKADMLTAMTLPEQFTNQQEQLASLPLYQMAEQLFRIFNLNDLPTQSAYICCFFDAINEFIQNSVADVKSFINYWDEKLNSKKIESDTENGIRIMSIHKSKGLEFDYVIMPYCDWLLEKKQSNMIWCKPTVQPFSTLNAVPLNYNSEMLNTIYEPYYWEEHLQNQADNLNLLYVAFTRAVEGLFVFSKAGQKEANRGKLIFDCLSTKGFTDSLPGSTFTDNIFTFGALTPQHPTPNTQHPSPNVFLLPFTSHEVTIKTSTTLPEFRQSNQSKDFTLTDEDEEAEQRSQYIKLGNVLHSLFAEIKTIDDIPAAVLRLEMNGMLYGQDITADYLRDKIENSLRDPFIRSWFDASWTLHNECTILEYDELGNTVRDHRPDRVMTKGDQTIIIDFKLSHDRPEYHDQLRRYANLLRKMGHTNIQAYLFFLLPGKYLEVK